MTDTDLQKITTTYHDFFTDHRSLKTDHSKPAYRLNEQVKRNEDRFPSGFSDNSHSQRRTRWSQIATTLKILDPPPPQPPPPPPEIGFHVKEDVAPYRVRTKRSRR